MDAKVVEFLHNVPEGMSTRRVALALRDELGLSPKDLMLALYDNDGMDLSVRSAAWQVRDVLRLSPPAVAQMLAESLDLSPDEVAWTMIHELGEMPGVTFLALREGLHLDAREAVEALRDGPELEPWEIAGVLHDVVEMDLPDVVSAMLDAGIRESTIRETLSDKSRDFQLRPDHLAQVMLEGKILHDERFREMAMVLAELSDMRESILKNYLSKWSEELAPFVGAQASAVEAVLRRRWDYPKTRDEQSAPAN